MGEFWGLGYKCTIETDTGLDPGYEGGGLRLKKCSNDRHGARGRRCEKPAG